MEGKECLSVQSTTMFASWYLIHSSISHFRLAEKSRSSPVPISDTYPDPKVEEASGDSREDLVPLNLSKWNQSGNRPDSSDGEELKKEELPLNLCLRPLCPRSVPNPLEERQDRPDVELEDPFDQRQTAALALCQLSIASTAASSCDFTAADHPSEDCRKERISSSKSKHKTKTTSLKRTNSNPTKNQANKRAKTPEWHLRRRPRCC